MKVFNEGAQFIGYTVVVLVVGMWFMGYNIHSFGLGLLGVGRMFCIY